MNANDPINADLIPAKSGWGVAGGNAEDSKKGGFAKTDPRHWEPKLFKHTYLEGGRRIESRTYSVRIAHRGQRHNIPLGVAELRKAAKCAAEVYKRLMAEGWAPILASFRTVEAEPEKPAAVTVGAWIASARAISRVGARSFEDYARSLRLIAAGVAGLKSDSRRFGPGKGGAAKWRAAVEAVPLESLTVPAVESWMADYARQAGADPAARQRRQNGCNSVLRMARALFSQDLIGRLSSSMPVPHPYPFAGVKPFAAGTKVTRYRSRIDAGEILRLAKVELGANPARREEWKALLLALCAGLRKSEIDCLAWSEVHLARGAVRIERTAAFAPKSADSEDDVDLDPEVVETLRGLRAHATGQYYLESALPPKPNATSVYYRARATWERLNEWLRSKGVPRSKPIHEMRKELGAILASKAGIYAAQRVLRHAQISTTAAYYADRKTALTGGLGRFLADTEPAGAILFTQPAESVPAAVASEGPAPALKRTRKAAK